jgi:hypothetical protein
MSTTRFAGLASIALGAAALTASSAWAQAPGGPVTSDDAGSPPYESPPPSASDGGGVTFMPRLGADMPLGDSLSIYPQFELGIGHQTVDETGEGSGDQYVDDTISVNLYVPLLVHPAPHVFIGFGPSVYHEVSSAVTYPTDPLAPAVQNRETTLGAGLVVGGWL